MEKSYHTADQVGIRVERVDNQADLADNQVDLAVDTTFYYLKNYKIKKK